MVKQDGKWGFFMFMSEAIQEFGFDCKIRKLSPKTIANYQKQMKYLQRYLDSEFKVKEVEAIKSVHIKQFLSMKDDQGCKARYINDLLKVFKTFLTETHQYDKLIEVRSRVDEERADSQSQDSVPKKTTLQSEKHGGTPFREGAARSACARARTATPARWSAPSSTSRS